MILGQSAASNSAGALNADDLVSKNQEVLKVEMICERSSFVDDSQVNTTYGQQDLARADPSQETTQRERRGKESSDLTQPPSFGERYVFNHHRIGDYQNYGSAAKHPSGESSIATIERELQEKVDFKEQKMKELEQKRRADLMSCSSSSSSVLTIPPKH